MYSLRVRARIRTRFVGHRGAWLARREKGECREHLTDEQRHQTGWIGGRKEVGILARALSRDESMGTPLKAGAHVSQRLTLASSGKTHGGHAKVRTGLGKSDRPRSYGGSGNVAHGGTVHSPRNQKGGSGDPPPYRCARPGSIPTVQYRLSSLG